MTYHQHQPQPPRRSSASKVAMIGCLGVFGIGVLFTGCVAVVAVSSQDVPTESDPVAVEFTPTPTDSVEDISDGIPDEFAGAALEYAWETLSDEQRDEICMLWEIDSDLAMDIFSEGQGEDPTIADDQAIDFFNEKCGV